MPINFENIVIEPIAFGYEHYDDSRLLRSFVRSHFRIHYIIEGSGYYHTNGKSFFVTKNEGYFIYPGQECTPVPSKGVSWNHIWIAFKISGDENLIDNLGVSRDYPIYNAKHGSISMREALVDLFNIMLFSQNETTNFTHGMLRVLGNVQGMENEGSKNSKFFNEILDYIHKNYRENITIEDIASQFEIDRTYVYKLFMKHASVSPKEYILNRKIQDACDLLQNTDHKITEIAYIVGFNNSSDFYRQFKKITKMTAKEYKKQSVYTSESTH